MKKRATRRLFIVITVFMTTFLLMPLIQMADIETLPDMDMTVHAVDGVQYVERHWDDSEVVKETKTANCSIITDSTEDINGWYVVNSNVNSSERLVVTGTANIILCDGARLYLKDGINVPAGKTLNIYGQENGTGELYCDADTNDNAAIGANETSGDCGTINIHGGVITADTKKKGEDAAGIGGGEEGNGGNITIYGGTVKAYGGSANDDGGAGIGGGDRDGDKGGNGGNVKIYGGDVTAVGGANAAGIGGGDDGGTAGTVEIYGGTVNATGGSKYADGGAGIGGGNSGDGGNIYIYGGTVTATGGPDAAGIGGGDAGSGGHIEIRGGTVTATGDGNAAGIGGGDDNGGGTIKISGGTVTATGASGAAGIGGGDGGTGNSGDITISGGEVTATGGDEAAGIGGGNQGPSDNSGTITISGGKVIAKGGTDYGAGIGGGDEQKGGAIRISGGEIVATGGNKAAGIGGGDDCIGGDIIITGGKIKADGGSGAAGIGGGHNGSGGTIQINSDSDYLIEANGGNFAAGIGGGQNESDNEKNGSGGEITIQNGKIKASGFKAVEHGGAGIGGGQKGNSGTIKIQGGDIDSLGGIGAAGIGAGQNAKADTITISGGTIKASSKIQTIDGYMIGGAGIGSGSGHAGGDIDISGGDITVVGGAASAGIGGGQHGDGGTIDISGGTIDATGGTLDYEHSMGGAGIGGGGRANGGTINISGGNVTAKGGRFAAGIGGGREKGSGKIRISGSAEVSAVGGEGGGAGIGSGTACSESNSVDITIDGGKVTARNDGEDYYDVRAHKRYTRAAAIGAGGRDVIEGVGTFEGNIYFNGGEVYIEVEKVFAIGAPAKESIVDGKGKVFFNGATVTMRFRYGEPRSTMAGAGEIYIKETEDFHQSVRGYDDYDHYIAGKASIIAPRDKRIDMLGTMLTVYVVEVKECDHIDCSFEDKGTKHIRTCRSCNAAGIEESHTYDAPVWTWASDYSSATATFKCNGDGCGHEETKTATTTSREIEGDTPAHKKIEYTATVEFEGGKYTDSRIKKNADEAKITTEPKAKELTYLGRPQALVTAGVVEDGTMMYALAEKGDEPKENDYSAEIPKGTNAGTYYVWFKADGDDTHADTEPACVEARIKRTTDVEFSLEKTKYVYTGNAIEPKVITKVNGEVIELKSPEFFVGYTTNTNVGKAFAVASCSGDNIFDMAFLLFEIVKADNNVSVSMDNLIVGEPAGTPKVTADFDADKATFKYKAKDADDSTYSETVPTAAGDYTVKATIPGTGNYKEGTATDNFSIITQDDIVRHAELAETIKGGTAEISPELIKTGYKVTIKTMPESGWQTKGVEVAKKDVPTEKTSAQKDESDANKYTYTQPAYDVIVTPVFEKVAYDIATPVAEGEGTVSVTDVKKADDDSKAEDTNKASVGDIATITATPGTGNALSSLTVQYTDEEGEAVTIDVVKKENSTYEFTMPAADVTFIKAIFAPYVPLEDKPEIKVEKAEGNTSENPQIGDVLTTETTATPLTYQWFANGAAIEGANSKTLDVTKELVGKNITVKATQPKDAGGSGQPEEDVEKESDAVGPVGKKSCPDITEIDAGLKYDYAGEKVTPGEGYEVSKEQTDSETPTTLDSLTGILDGNGKFYVRKAATEDTMPSKWVEVSIARVDAPRGITASKKATDDRTNDGAIINVNDRMEYSVDDGSTWTAVPPETQTVTGLPAGDVQVRYAAIDRVRFAGKIATVTVDKKTPQDKPESEFPATKESEEGANDAVISGVDATMEYSTDGGKTWTPVPEDATEISGFKGGDKVLIRKAATEDLAPSEAVEVDIETRIKPDAPADLDAEYVSEEGASDGSIRGTDETMEYSADNGVTWTPVTGGTIDGLAEGEYLVRYKETDDIQASDPVTVTVGVKEDNPNKPEVSASDASDAKASDGKISGVDDTMEFSADGGKTWSRVPEGATEITGLHPGKVLVRYAATATVKASEAVEVVIGAKNGPDKSTVKPVLVAKGIAKGQTAVNISWNKVSGADRYVIYLGRCNYKGRTYKMKKVKVVNGKKFKWTKTRLKKRTAYKFYVVAQKKSGGSYKNIAKSVTGHFFTGKIRGKYTDPKSLKLAKSTLTLSNGKSATIKASVTKARKNKKLATGHAPKLRYISNNPSVATVNSKGKITAKSSGTAVIYVQTINGIWKTCKVTVK